MRAAWAFAGVVVVGLAVACGGSSETSTADDDSGGTGGTSGSSSGGTSGASSGGSSPTGGSANGGGTGGASGGSAGSGGSGGVCGCVDSEVHWGMDGGFVAYGETSTLTPCATFSHARDPAGGTGPSIGCTQEITSCASGVGPASVADALADPDVRAAVMSAPVLYGADSRPLDGQVQRVEIDGAVIEVGQPCGGIPDCLPIPTGVADLVELLESMNDLELARGQCADAFEE